VADVVAVLVVPADGDPGGLRGSTRLALPRCPSPVEETHAGAPPMVVLSEPPDYPEALPLWWDGALVPEGWDRARRAWSHAPGHTPLGVGHRFEVSLDQAEMVGLDLVQLGLASRVVRLARVDGRLVEVSP
jgi:hypothetical protein